jgi:MFS family permease
MTMSSEKTRDAIRSLVPARIDRLSWSKFHTRMVIALGVAWVLDGLEIGIASTVSPYLEGANTLHMNKGSVAFSVGTIYLLGEVFGALFFGRLSDRWGRRNLFMITLGVYLIGGGLSALTFGHSEAWVLWLDLTRFIAGAGIGGEYAAINSAIDELIPAKYRGRVDIAVNGTYWGGAFIADAAAVWLIPHLSTSYSWRIGFLIGPMLGFIILFVRRGLPESPRWLIMRGRVDEAEAAVTRIEQQTEEHGGHLGELDESKAILIQPMDNTGYLTLTKTLFSRYPARSVLGASLMITQSFLYNSIFFTYSLVLTSIYGVSTADVGYYGMAFAIGNLAGPLLIGHLFDSIGRKKMISGTYLTAGVLLAITAVLFRQGDLTATTQTLCWVVIFFFASSGASAAYLTVSEIFPVEVRAKAIAVFFAIAQCFGSLGPWLYGKLIGATTKPHSYTAKAWSSHLLHHSNLFWGFLLGAAVMCFGGVIELLLGVHAEGKSLEDVAEPLSAVSLPTGRNANPTGAPRPPVA